MEQMTFSSFRAELYERISRPVKAAIITHVNPDGDGFAAALALQEIMLARDTEADIVLEEPISDQYDFLSGKERSIVFDKKLNYDLVIVLDCHEKKRLGVCADLLYQDQYIFVLDHHEEQESIPCHAKLINPEYVSVGTMIYEMFRLDILKMNAESRRYIARAIYTTILNDTDNYLNANVDKKTFIIAAELMDWGMKPGKIVESFLMRKSLSKVKLVGEVLAGIDTRFDDKILFMVSTRSMLEANGLDQRANDKMTGWIKGTEGVEVIVFLQEDSDQHYKISLRSNVINVNKIAVKHGGGGHIKASGCSMSGSLDTIKEQLYLDILEQYK